MAKLIAWLNGHREPKQKNVLVMALLGLLLIAVSFPIYNYYLHLSKQPFAGETPAKTISKKLPVPTITSKKPFKVTLPKDAAQPLTFTVGADQIEVALSSQLSALSNRSSVSRNKATYFNVYKNTNLERIITSQGLKQNYILTKAGHPDSFSETISGNTTVKLQKDGSLSYYGGSDGKATQVIATSPKPHLTDAKGKVVSLSYALSGDKLTIKLPSLKGLSYPIAVDPSIVLTDFTTGTAQDPVNGIDTSTSPIKLGQGTVNYPLAPSGYTYIRRVPITNDASTTLATGYQVPVIFNHQFMVNQVKSKDNGDDLRVFYDNGTTLTEISRFLDAGAAWNQTNTKIWFKTQADVAASATDNNYYLVYGNALAANPPATGVFGLYDPAVNDPSSAITRYSNITPILSPGPGTYDIHGGGMYGQNVIKDGNTYKMYYSGYGYYDPDSWPYKWRVSLATSSDGITWTKSPFNPIIDVGLSGNWDSDGIHAPSVLKEGSNDYKMWYSGIGSGGNWRIGYATSTDGVNWVRYGTSPVLDLGAPGSYDGVHAYGPNVIKDGGIYKMYYNLHDGAYVRVGMATSSDGITWTKYDGPDVDTNADPVVDIGSPGAWDDTYVSYPSVIKDSDGTYKMWYAGYNYSGWQGGYAYSNDGLNWNKNAAPILTTNSDYSQGAPFDGGAATFPAVLKDGEAYKIFYSGSDYAQWQIGLAYAMPRSVITPEPTTTISPEGLGGTSSYYVSPATLTSGTIDSGQVHAKLDSMSWETSGAGQTTQPNFTELKFQIATSMDGNTWSDFVGPDKTTSTYFTNAAGHSATAANLGKYFKYKAYFSTTDPNATPFLTSVTLNYIVAISGDTPGGDLVVDGVPYTITGDHQGPNGYNSITVKDGGVLSIQPNDTDDGAVIDVANNVLVTGNSSIIPMGYYTKSDDLDVDGVGWPTDVTDYNGRGVTVNAKNVEIKPGSKINADGQGYGAGAGPGKGSAEGSSGSYGGKGMLYLSSLSGNTYGLTLIKEPIDLGSGGTGNDFSYDGNPGGGAVKLAVSGTLINDGAVTANGNAYGGIPIPGSGGSIYIDANNLSGNGSFVANGGRVNFNSFGGGGRVAIFYNDRSNWISSETDVYGNVDVYGKVDVYGNPDANTEDDGSKIIQSKNSVDSFSNQADSTIPLKTGATTKETAVNLSFWYMPDDTAAFTPEIEVQPVGTAFTNTPNYSTAPISTTDSLYRVSVPVTGLSNGSYHWQARIVGTTTKDWVSYGDNSDGDPPTTLADADFIVDTSASSSGGGSTYPDFVVGMFKDMTNTQALPAIYQNNVNLSGAFSTTFNGSVNLNAQNQLNLAGDSANLALGSGSSINTPSLLLSPTGANALTLGDNSSLSVAAGLTLDNNKTVTLGPGSIINTPTVTLNTGANLNIGSNATLMNPLPVTASLALLGGTLTAGDNTKLDLPVTFASNNLALGANSVITDNADNNGDFNLASGQTITMGNGSTYQPITNINGGTLALGNNSNATPANIDINNITLNSGSLALSSNATITRTTDFTVGQTGAATLTVGGKSTLDMSSSNLTVTNGSSIIPLGYYTESRDLDINKIGWPADANDFNGRGLTVNAKNVLIDAGSFVNADEKGYPENTGPGTPGGYGGRTKEFRTWDNYYNYYGSTYGSKIQPVDLGSGGQTWETYSGKSGGGAIKIAASGTITNNGTISANGGSRKVSSLAYAGGGSGGSIFLVANNLAGSGSIHADGGLEIIDLTAGNGRGGGGLIALHIGNETFTGPITVAGGEDGFITRPGSNLNVESFSNQAKINGETPLKTGEATEETGLTLNFWYKATSNDYQVFTPEVEVKPIGVDFNGSSSDLYTGPEVVTDNALYRASVSIPSGSFGNGSYHWRARFKYGGIIGPWSYYEGNDKNKADFKVNTTSPGGGSGFPDAVLNLTRDALNNQSGLKIYQNNININGGYTLTFGNQTIFSAGASLNIKDAPAKLILGSSSTLSVANSFSLDESKTISLGDNSTLSASAVNLYSGANYTMGNNSTVNMSSFTNAGSFTAGNNSAINISSALTNTGTLGLGNNSTLDVPTITLNSGSLTIGDNSSFVNPIAATSSLTINGGAFTSGDFTNLNTPAVFKAGAINLGDNSAVTADALPANLKVGTGQTITMGDNPITPFTSINVNGGLLSLGANFSYQYKPLAVSAGSLSIGSNANLNIIGDLNIDSYFGDTVNGAGLMSIGHSSILNVLGDINIGNNFGQAKFSVGGNSVVSAPYHKIVLAKASTVTAKGYVDPDFPNDGRGITIKAKDVEIDATSKIDADGLGYASGSGPGAGHTPPGAGASYGGRGGAVDNVNSPSADPYGFETQPIDLGSGGLGAPGGGAVKLEATGTLTNDGIITASSPNFISNTGGSGGSIYLDVANLTGSGSLKAVGSSKDLIADNYPAGGGGRIAVYYRDKTNWSGVIDKSGGLDPLYPGEAGTLYMPTARPYNLTHEYPSNTSIKWKWQESEATDAAFKVYSGAHSDSETDLTLRANVAGGAAKTGADYYEWTQNSLPQNGGPYTIHVHAVSGSVLGQPSASYTASMPLKDANGDNIVINANNAVQRRADTQAVINAGDAVNTRDVQLEASSLGGAVDSTNVAAQFEVKPADEPFNAITDLYEGNTVVANSSDTSKITVKLPDEEYHWRVRIKDNNGRFSVWTEFGATGDDFIIDNIAPVVFQKPVIISSVENPTKRWIWGEATDERSGIDGYYFYLGRTPGATDIINDQNYPNFSNSPYIELNGTIPAGTYYAFFKAADKATNISSNSDVSPLEILADTLSLATPSNLNVVADTANAEIELGFKAPTAVTLGQGDYYNIYRSTAGPITESNKALANVFTSNTNSFIDSVADSDILLDTTYYYQVSAVVGGLESALSTFVVNDNARINSLGNAEVKVSVNKGADYSKDTMVMLDLSAQQFDATQVSFSSDGVNYSPYELFTPFMIKIWTVPDMEIQHTVYARFKNAANNVMEASDSIVLDTTPPIGSLVINNNDYYVNKRSVDLRLQSADNGPFASGLAKMMISENSNFTGANWQDYQENTPFTLSEGDERKTVYAKYMDKAGNIGPARTFTDKADWDSASTLTNIDTYSSLGDAKIRTLKTDEVAYGYITGLKIGSVPGQNRKWKTLAWNAEGLSENHRIGIQVKTANILETSDDNYVNPIDGSDSYYYLNSNSNIVDLSSSFANTKLLEVRVKLESFESYDPFMHDLTVNYLAYDSISLNSTKADNDTGAVTDASFRWTTKGDFEDNAPTTGTSTNRNNIEATGSLAEDDADLRILAANGLEKFGNGLDGALNANTGGEVVLDIPRAAINANSSAGQNVLSVADTTGFAPGQKVLVSQLFYEQRTGGVGEWKDLNFTRRDLMALPNAGQEEAQIASVDTANKTLTMTQPLKNAYYFSDMRKVYIDSFNYNLDYGPGDDKKFYRAQVMKINQYSTVNVSGDTTLTVPAWDYDTGTAGMLYFKATGKVTVADGSKIDLTGKGYPVNEGPGVGNTTLKVDNIVSYYGFSGGSYGGLGGYGYEPTTKTKRLSGESYGTKEGVEFMGSSGLSYYYKGGLDGDIGGGLGGGRINISAASMDILGGIQANGKGGSDGNGSGGGSGGGILLNSPVIKLDPTGYISAAGGGAAYNDIGGDGFNGIGGNGFAGGFIMGTGGIPGSPPGDGGSGWQSGIKDGGFSAGGGAGIGTADIWYNNNYVFGGGGAGRISINYDTFNGQLVNGGKTGYMDAPGASNHIGPHAYYNRKPATYFEGILGGNFGSTGLQADAGYGNKYYWTKINYTAEPLTAGQEIKLQIRVADTLDDLKKAEYSGPDGTDETWFDAKNNEIPADLPDSRYAEVQVKLVTTDGVSPILHDVSLYHGEIPKQAALGLGQLQDDGLTPIDLGMGTNKDKVTFKGLTTGGLNDSEQLKMQFELKPVKALDFIDPAISNMFDESSLVDGSLVDPGGTSSALVSMPINESENAALNKTYAGSAVPNYDFDDGNKELTDGSLTGLIGFNNGGTFDYTIEISQPEEQPKDVGKVVLYSGKDEAVPGSPGYWVESQAVNMQIFTSTDGVSFENQGVFYNSDNLYALTAVFNQTKARYVKFRITGNNRGDGYYAGINITYLREAQVFAAGDGRPVEGAYHWRSRVVDELGRVSNWTSFGGNTDGGSGFAPGTDFYADYTKPTKPGVPTTADPTYDKTPTLKWDESTDALSGIKGYNIYVSTQPPGTDADIVNGTFTSTNSFTVPNTLNNGIYYAWVAALDNSNNTETSDYSAFNVTDTTDITWIVPSNLMVLADTDNTNVYLNWQAPSGGVDHYRIYRYSEPVSYANKYKATVLSDAVGSTVFTDSTGVEGQTYYYQVAAVDALGAEGPLSILVLNDKATVTSPQATWTTKEDFENNASTTGGAAVFSTGIDTFGLPGDVRLVSKDIDFSNVTLGAVGSGPASVYGIKNNGKAVSSPVSSSWEDNLNASIGLKSIASSQNFGGGGGPTGLKEDGTTVGAYVLSGIKAIDASIRSTLALREDGTVIGYGGVNSYSGMENWVNIKAVAASDKFSLGLKNSGQVVGAGDSTDSYASVNNYVLTGYPEDIGDYLADSVIPGVDTWQDIKAIAAGDIFSIGLKNDGTVVGAGVAHASKYSYSRDDFYPVLGWAWPIEVSSWTNIKAISVGAGHVVGLKEDGTVVAAGDGAAYSNADGNNQVVKWKNISAVAAGGGFTVGLKTDGTIVGAGSVSQLQYYVYALDWTDIRQPTYVYNQPETISGLKVKASGDFKARWGDITWSADVPVGSAVKFRTRGADTEDGLASAIWSDYYTTSGDIVTTAPSTYLEVEAFMQGSGNVAPVLHSLNVSYKEMPKLSASTLKQYAADGTEIYAGGQVNKGDVTLSVTNVKGLTGSQSKAEFEVKPKNTPFNGADTRYGNLVSAGSDSSVIVNIADTGAYHWRARVIDNSVINSGASTEWVNYNNDGTAFTAIDPALVPGKPFTVSPTDDTTPAWNWSLSAAANVVGYKFYLGTTAGAFDVVNGEQIATNSFTHITPLPYGTYYAYVRSVYADAGLSEASQIGSVNIIGAYSVISIPNNLNAYLLSQNSTDVSLRWQPPIMENADYYKIYRSYSRISDKSLADYIGQTSTLTFSDLTTQKGKTYYYQVTAVDSTGSESGLATLSKADSDRVTIPLTVIGNPEKPDELQQLDSANNKLAVGSAIGNGNNIVFKAKGIAGASDAVFFKAQFEVKPVGQAFNETGIAEGNVVYPRGSNQEELSAAESSTKINLAEGAYRWRARIIDDIGRTSDWVNFSTAVYDLAVDTTPPSKPATPTTTTPTADNKPTWTWTASTDNASGIDHYLVYLGTAPSNFNIVNGATANVNSYTSSALDSGDYYLAVKAVDKAGNESEISDMGTVNITFGLPSNLNAVAQANTTAIELTWTGPSLTEIDHYNVYRYSEKIDDNNLYIPDPNNAGKKMLNPDIKKLAEVGAYGYIDTATLAGETYYYQVTAVDNDADKTEGNVSIHVKNDYATALKINENGDNTPPHWGFNPTTGLCKNCHSVHLAKGSKKIFRKAPNSKNDNVEICFTCHDGSGSAFDIKSYFTDKGAHDVGLDKPEDTLLKCMNCHHPHNADASLAGSTYSAGGERMTRGKEEKLCFKCHNESKNGEEFATGTVNNTPGHSKNNWDIKAQFNLEELTLETHPMVNSETIKGKTCQTCHGPQIVGDGQSEKGFNYSRHAITGTTRDKLTGAKIECSSCHGPHSVERGNTGSDHNKRLVDPFNTFNLWGGTFAEFCLNCHQDGTLPTQSSQSDPKFVPYSIQFPKVEAPYFYGWDKTDFRKNPAAHNRMLDDGQGHQMLFTCQNCHHPHGSQNPRLNAFFNIADKTWDTSKDAAYEQNLCLKCHTDGNPYGAPDIESVLNKANTGGTAHPVKKYDGRHKDTEGDQDLGKENRHAECVDCHDPHKAKRGVYPTDANGNRMPPGTPTGLPFANGPQVGAWGIGVLNGIPGISDTVLYPMRPIVYEYQLCFKCHSSNVELLEEPQGDLRYPPQDKATEFNTNNPSFHPVEGLGKNLGIKDEAFTPGTPWNPTPDKFDINGNRISGDSGDDPDYGLDADGNIDPSYKGNVKCTDCHNNPNPAGAYGPHGSDNRKLLKAPFYYFEDTGNDTGGCTEMGGCHRVKAADKNDLTKVDGNRLCFKCHNEAVYRGGYEYLDATFVNADRNGDGVVDVNGPGVITGDAIDLDGDGDMDTADKTIGNILTKTSSRFYSPSGQRPGTHALHVDDGMFSSGLPAGKPASCFNCHKIHGSAKQPHLLKTKTDDGQNWNYIKYVEKDDNTGSTCAERTCHEAALVYPSVIPAANVIQYPYPHITADPSGIINYGENSMAKITYTGKWWMGIDPLAVGGRYIYAPNHQENDGSASSATLSFTGSKVTWYSKRGPDGALAAIYIDNKLDTEIDLTSFADTFQPVYASDTLASGPHTLTIKIVYRNTANAAGTTPYEQKLVIDNFRVEP